MTSQDPHELPNRRSPKALDDKILAYARENAPKRVRQSHGWMQFAALASVCVVTVLVVIPEHEQPAPFSEPKPTLLVEEAAEQQRVIPSEDRVEAKARSATPVIAKPTVPSKEVMAGKTFSKQGAFVSKKEAMNLTNSNARKTMKSQAEQSAQRYAPASTMADSADIAAVAAPEPKWSPELIEKLREIQRQLDAGKREAALAAYNTLRGTCTNCGLPINMDDALAKLSAKDLNQD